MAEGERTDDGDDLIPRRATFSPVPASFGQERLWFLDRLAPQEAAHNISTALRLSVRVDVAALERTLAEIAGRHEALRTTFATVDGRPVQVIAPAARPILARIELGHLSGPEAEAAASRIVSEEARRPFDLEAGPLLRAALVEIAPAESLLCLTLHHIVADGWSIGVLLRELRDLYGELVRGGPARLAPPPLHYADWAVWQRTRLQGDRLERLTRYWRSQLAGAPSVAIAPDHPAGPNLREPAQRLSATLSPALTRALSELAGREGCTVFILLLAALGTVLHRLTGRADLTIGTPIAGRNRPDLEGLIGFFLNVLVLRLDLSGDRPFQEVLTHAREVALDAYAHQDLPFEMVLAALGAKRELGRTPLFQVYLNHLNLSGDLGPPGGVDGGRAGAPPALFDVALYSAEDEGALAFTLLYDPSVFTAGTMQRLLDGLLALLEAVVERPRARVSGLPVTHGKRPWPPSSLRGSQERSDGRPAGDESITRCFARQAALHPGRTAVSSREHRWTYQQLATAADAVARALVSRMDPAPSEAGPGWIAGARTALLVGHGAPMVGALLGALRAGCAYVPLDPHFPDARLASILEDCSPSLVLVDRAHADRAAAFSPRTPVLEVESLLAGARNGIAPDIDEPRPETVAYILYTSGTTGRPKGVFQTHRNVLHHCRTYAHALGIGPGDVVCGLASYAFDAAVMDMFGALLSGAELRLIDVREGGLEPLAETIAECGVTVYHSTPTVFRSLLLRSRPRGALARSRIRSVVLGGEEACARDVALFRDHFPRQAVLVNGLGPTECTLALQHRVDTATTVAEGPVPVGHPVDGVEALVLDADGREVEYLASGEIVLQSEFLAPGYWRQPDLTQAAFSPGDGRRRRYRTGDWGRRLPDGAIEFVGRRDLQVKVRGHRVELDEVRMRLRTHPGVADALIVTHEQQPGERALAAYVVPAPDSAVTEVELRGFLGRHLPEFMLPSTFVFLAAFPVSPNGKIDRRALPAPGAPIAAAAAVQPRNRVERELARIWADILGAEVGIHDSFFERGGQSLQATQMISRVHALLGVALPLRAVFEAPTIAALAERIAQGGMATVTGPPALRPAARARYEVRITASVGPLKGGPTGTTSS